MKREANLEKRQGRRIGSKKRSPLRIATAGSRRTPFPSAREERSFREAIEESIISGIAAFDTEGRQTYANPAFCKMVGRSQEELSGKEPPFVYWPREERETIAKAFRKILEGEKPRGRLELRFQRRNGERFDALLLFSVLTDESGHRKGWVMSAGDFTQQKRAEEEMRWVNAELEERVRQRTGDLESIARELEEKVAETKKMGKRIAHLASFPELNPNPVVEIDLAGQVQYLNAAAERLFPDLAIRGKDHPYSADLEPIAAFFKDGKVDSRDRDIQVGPSWYHQTLHYSPQWERIRIYGFDNTEQKKTEAGLRETEEKFRELYEGSHDGYARVDMGGKIQECNTAFREMLGYKPEELKKLTYLDLTPRKWHGLEAEIVQKEVLLRGYSRVYEKEYIRKDGTIFPVSLRAYLIKDPEGTPLGMWAFVRDITERKRAEEELRKTNERLNLLSEVAGKRADELDRLVRERTQDLSERIKELNCLCTVSGLLNEEEASPEDILQRMVDLLPSGWQCPEIACARAVLEEREYRTENFRETPWLQTSAIISQGRQVGILEVGYLEERPGRDEGPFLEEERTLLDALADQVGEFLERKRAEDGLKSSSRYTRSLIEASLDPLVTISPAGKITDANRATELVTGVPRQKLIGSDFSDYFTEPQKAREGYEQVFQRGAVWDYPLAIRHVSGNVTDVLYNASVFRNEAGEVQGVFAAARDITERKQAEEAWRQNEKLLRNILELLPVGVWITDRKGVITYGNPAGHRIWAGDRYVGIDQFKEPKGWWLATGKPIEPEEWAVARALRKGETSLNEEIEIECFDGSHKFILNSAIPLRNEKNEITGAFVIDDDITERRRTEQAVRQVQKMEALGTLAGGIAHDFNNILMPIVINTELALMDVKKGVLPSSNYLGLVKEAATRGQGLVKQIITFSRQREQPREPVNLNPVIKEALKFLRASIPKNIEIRSSIEVEPAVVLADPTQIHQVLMNLCSNAAFAMRGKKGLLQVIVTRVEVDREAAAQQADLKPGSYLRLTVSDTGHGMNPEVRDRAFDPFFTTKKPGEGTGMGLAVVHGIVKNHEGALTLESEVGKGTTVHVFLPWVQAEEPREYVPSEPIPTGKERILLVDDEEMQVQTLQHMLERLGYRVIGKTSALEALETFRSQPDVFDLVITDQTMPVLTGAELSRELLGLRPDLPIILSTGYSETFDEEEARAIGIRDFAPKPLTVTGLAERIRKALKK